MFLGAQPGHALAALAGYPTPTARGASLLGWWSGDHDHEARAASGYDPDIAGASWTKSLTTVTGGQSDPDGGNNAFLLTDSNDGGTPQFHHTFDVTMSAATALPECDIWLKSGTQNRHYVVIGDTAGANRTGIVNSATGAIVGVEGSARAHHIETRGDWRLFRVIGEATAQKVQLLHDNGSGVSYAGTATGTFYAYAPAGSYRARLIQDADGVPPDFRAWSASPGMNVTVNVSVPGAFNIYDANDAAPAVYTRWYLTPNALANRPVRWEFQAKPGTLSRAIFLLSDASPSWLGATLDLASKSVVTLHGAATVQVLGTDADGMTTYCIEATPTANMRAQLLLVQSGTTWFYQGDGTGYVTLRSSLGAYEQKRAAHLPLVGSSSLAVQATDAARPILTADHFAGTRSLLFSGAQAVNADHITAAHNFRTQDWTIICLADFTASPSADESLWCLGTSGNQILTLYRDVGGMLRVLLTSYGTGPTYDFALGPATSPLNRQAIAVVHRTVGSDKTLEFYRNGSGGGGNIIAPAAIDYATLTIGAVRASPYSNYFQGRMREIGIFSAALSPTDVRMLSYGMRARGRLSPGGL
jgi:hypothetical protein